METIKMKVKEGFTLVDLKTYKKYKHLPWRIRRGRVVADVYLHRLIIGEGGYKKKEVDHINRDPLDNRIENLRFCTHRQNCINKIYKIEKQFRGVFWEKRCKKWYAQLIDFGEKFRGPLRSDPVEAANDYNNLAVRHHREFAVLNVINSGPKKMNL